MDTIYLTIPYVSSSRYDILEVERGGSGDWVSRIRASFTATYVDCTCELKEQETCIHRSIVRAELTGPTIQPNMADALVMRCKQVFQKASDLVVPVGNTRFKRKPIQRIDLLGQSASDGVELWSYWEKYLVRLVLSAPANMEKTMDRINSEVIIDLDDGKVIDF